MHILGFQKTTLLDYPQKLASTIFLAGCNFRCPFCHNADLVIPHNYSFQEKNLSSDETTDLGQAPQEYSMEEILHTLAKRSHLLEGVCVTGGEPTLNSDLPILLKSIKDLGLLVKLDTNGSNPRSLAFLIEQGLIDYVAMDIKNSPAKYSMTAGHSVDLDAINESIELLKLNPVDYEFRTTILREFHQEKDIIAIGKWLAGGKRYFLQNFVNSEKSICPNTFSSYAKSDLEHFRQLLCADLPNVFLRGID